MTLRAARTLEKCDCVAGYGLYLDLIENLIEGKERIQTGMTREAIIDSLIRHFEGRYDTRSSDFTEAELAAAQALVQTKFLSDEWTHRVP